MFNLTWSNDIMTFIHLFIYPLITGMLFVLMAWALVRGTRWIIVFIPAFIVLTMLALITHVNYMGYLAL